MKKQTAINQMMSCILHSCTIHRDGTSTAAPLSPGQRHVMREMEKTSQGKALHELLKIEGANKNKRRHDDIRNIVRKYQGRGLEAVTERNLQHPLQCTQEGKPTKDSNNHLPVRKIDFQLRSDASPLKTMKH
jgi:hypothetical protein